MVYKVMRRNECLFWGENSCTASEQRQRAKSHPNPMGEEKRYEELPYIGGTKAIAYITKNVEASTFQFDA